MTDLEAALQVRIATTINILTREPHRVDLAIAKLEGASTLILDAIDRERLGRRRLAAARQRASR